MISFKNKKIIILATTALSIVLLAGCASTSKSNNPVPSTSATKPASTNDNSASTNTSIKSPENTTTKEETQGSTLLASIRKLAEQGKIINCDFAAKTTTIDDVEKVWGKADSSEWIAQAKGLYTTFSKHNVVFGSNKGDQIFEVRSFDSRLAQISLSAVKKAFGTPAYDVKTSVEEVIGYTTGKEFKILLVFPQPKAGSEDPMLKHYSVLYPAGTVNNMAGDPGRQW